MAGDIVKTKYTDSEISKSSDFAHTASSPFEIIDALMDGMFDDVAGSFVVSGLAVSQMSTPSMNVQIGSGVAYHRGADKLLHLAAPISAPVDPAHATLDRIDTLEIRYKETDFDEEVRAFKDPASGTVSYANASTKTKISLEARCLAGTPGSGVAPDAEAGWMKLAEVAVDAAATAIFDVDIFDLTAEADATDNDAWTAEKQVTFNLKSVATIKKEYLAHVASNITGANTVHGIRQGHGNGFDGDTLDGMQPASVATPSTVMSRDALGRAKVANPATSGDIATKDYVDARVPTATLAMFAGSAAPSGWLLCDGSAVSRTTYAALFTALGGASSPWGLGDGSSTFNLPDFREAAPVGLGNRASGVTAHDEFTLGQFKDDQEQGHKHEMLHYRGATNDGSIPGTGDTSLMSYQYSTSIPITDGVNGTPRTGTVTRGKRIGVNFIIKS